MSVDLQVGTTSSREVSRATPSVAARLPLPGQSAHAKYRSLPPLPQRAAQLPSNVDLCQGPEARGEDAVDNR